MKAHALGLSTVSRTWCIYGARIPGPVPVPSRQSGYQLYGHFRTVYIRVSEILHEFHLFQFEHAYPCSFDALPQFPAVISGIEGGYTAHIRKYSMDTVRVW